MIVIAHDVFIVIISGARRPAAAAAAARYRRSAWSEMHAAAVSAGASLAACC